jgi:hypothetical protein
MRAFAHALICLTLPSLAEPMCERGYSAIFIGAIRVHAPTAMRPMPAA